MDTSLTNYTAQSRIEHYIFSYVTEHYPEAEEQRSFFSDLFSGGCASGMISSLIYYYDTHKFYDEYYHEIEDLRYEYEESTGCELHPNGDLKNWFAWFGFETAAYNIASVVYEGDF